MSQQTPFEECDGCERFTGAECVLPWTDDLDLEKCFTGDIMTPLERKLNELSRVQRIHA